MGRKPARMLERMRDGLAEALGAGGDAEAVMTALRSAGIDDDFAAAFTADLVDDELWAALKNLLDGEADKPPILRRRARAAAADDDVEKDIMAAAERVREAMDEAAVDGGGLMPSQILEMIHSMFTAIADIQCIAFWNVVNEFDSSFVQLNLTSPNHSK